MPIEKTDGLVIKTQKFQETSKIAVLFTRDFGKIPLIAKGTRKTDSKLGGILETSNLLSIIFYYKPGRNVHLIKECDIIEPFIKIRDDFQKMTICYAIIEVLNRTIVEEDPNKNLFVLLVKTLESLNNTNKNNMNIYWYFVLKLLDILGFNINFSTCNECSKTLAANEAHFTIEKGGLLCKKCLSSNNIDTIISPDTFRILCKLQEIPVSSIYNLKPSKRNSIEINEILHRFMRYHVEGFRIPVSLGMLHNIK